MQIQGPSHISSGELNKKHATKQIKLPMERKTIKGTVPSRKIGCCEVGCLSKPTSMTRGGISLRVSGP